MDSPPTEQNTNQAAPAERSSGDFFRDALSREILQNEILRVTILAGLFAVIGVFIILSHQYLVHTPAGRNLDLRFFLLGALLLFLAAGYNYLLRFIFKGFARDGRRISMPVHYFNGLIEISVPTAVTFVFATVVGPAELLFSPPTFAYFLLIMLATLNLNHRLCLFMGAAAAAQYLGLFAYYSPEFHTYPGNSMLIAPPVHVARVLMYLFGGIVAAFVARELRKRFLNSLERLRDRDRVVEMFGKHVSPEVVDSLMNEPREFSGEIRSVCCMFLDIRGFTSFSENKAPGEVLDFLNSRFEFMIEIVNHNQGIINKFLGDGFMAVFGAPLSAGSIQDDCRNALRAAREIVVALEKRNQAETGAGPATRVGIGLHAGEAITGNVGSSLRKEYTIIGDTVNLAARIEQKTKELDARILISKAVRDHLREEVEAVSIQVDIRGRTEPVMVYPMA